jgi:hypothetical protein
MNFYSKYQHKHSAGMPHNGLQFIVPGDGIYLYSQEENSDIVPYFLGDNGRDSHVRSDSIS